MTTISPSRVDGELDVAAAGFDADGADAGDGGIGHALVFLVGEVWAGATVIESPVCTPIGSKFSIEQTMTTLSARSRITSNSNSFHPISDWSIWISEIIEASRPRAASVSNSSML